MPGRSAYQTPASNITAGCVKKICSPWTPPPRCCDVCTTDDDEAEFQALWDVVTEWLFHATCCQFPGCCPVETEPCPPCGCACADYCGCGPYASMSLEGAFCHEVCVTDGVPCLEFVFPSSEGEATIIGPDDGYWELRPDLLTVDWCKPFTNQCGSMWPGQDHCNDPWTIRAMVGKEPPGLLLRGAGQFVCEMLKECRGLDNCLPDGVRSITRRNITADIGPQFLETIDFDTQGTGIATLDMAIREWGCDSLPVRSYHNPLERIHQERRQVWTWRGKLKATPPTCAPGEG